MKRDLTKNGISFLERERKEKQRRNEDYIFIGGAFLFTAYIIISLLFGGR